MTQLEAVHRLTSQGVPAAQAARTVLGTQTTSPTTTTRSGGGHIGVGRANPAARGLGRAAMRLDAPTMIDIIEASLRQHGVVPTWERLICPVLRGLEHRQRGRPDLVDVEHLLSRSISEALAAVPRPPQGTPNRTLLACANEEQHSLPLDALAAAARRGRAGLPPPRRESAHPSPARGHAPDGSDSSRHLVADHRNQRHRATHTPAENPAPPLDHRRGRAWMADRHPTADDRPAHNPRRSA